MHYFIVIAIIAVIVIIQLHFLTDTKKKIDDFLNIFPEKDSEYTLNSLKDNEYTRRIKEIEDADYDEIIELCEKNNIDSTKYIFTKKDEDGLERTYISNGVIDVLKAKVPVISGIFIKHNNSVLKLITDSINDYLRNNKSVSDFHLMKDIVDRNCDALEDEINTQIPIPLYMGLVGTMAGILTGILYLWLTGGISDLLSAKGDSGADGVEALLGGVALAMISSILGILFTTWGSNNFKTVKSIVEKEKHTFLSWIQAKLLPTLSDNVVGAIREMTGNLTEFNKAFAINTGDLGTALGKVNESYQLQTRLLESVQRIADKDLTYQNLQLYNALKNSTQEIGTLAEYLHSTNDYLTNVRSLNEKLDLNENRTRTIEEIGAFFKTELEQIEARKGAISKAVGTVDDYLKQALEKLKENTEAQFNELQKSTIKQQDVLQRKSDEIEKLVTELEQLTAVKVSISRLEQTMKAQNSKLDNLVNAIYALAKAKAEGTNAPISLLPPKPKKQIWTNILIWVGTILGGLALVIFLIANWDIIYYNFIVNFSI